MSASSQEVLLDAAISAATWITAHPTTSLDLYRGDAGVLIFFLELFEVTGDERWAKEASSIAERILDGIEESESSGLYTGIAGMGFALSKASNVVGAQRAEAGCRRVLEILQRRSLDVEEGVRWNEVTDIISGSAGIGLFLLWGSERFRENRALNLAWQGGLALVAAAEPQPVGKKWRVSSSFDRTMPNFSHGTAGVAYFLARLYQSAGESEFLEHALEGGRYLQSIASTQQGGCLIPHHQPGGENLYYLGWCHGPAGTGRLFELLFDLTEDPQWRTWADRCGKSLLESGIPEKRTKGFWNNFGICCGDAGPAQFCLYLYRRTGSPEYLDLSTRLTSNILEHATLEEGGLTWKHAEDRTKPEDVTAQPGYMQGAAGIGSWLVRLHRFQKGRPGAIYFPDDPEGRLRDRLSGA